MSIEAARRVQVGDLTVAFRSVGAGEPLVLLHGFLCDSRAWRRQLEDLAEEFRLIAWDAPGAGESSDPPHTFTLTDWADCLSCFLEAVGVREANLVGLSWGGLLGPGVLPAVPSRVLRLVLADTSAGWLGSFGPEVARERLKRCEQESYLPPDQFVARWVPAEFFHDASVELIQETANMVSSLPSCRVSADGQVAGRGRHHRRSGPDCGTCSAPVGGGGPPIPPRYSRAVGQLHPWRRTGIDPRGWACQQHGGGLSG